MQKRRWAVEAIQKLQAGQMVQIKPIGRSMQGKVNNGDRVTLEPCHAGDLAVGDVVLARIAGRRYLHLVLHLIHGREADRFLIGSAHGRMDGWITVENIFGKVH